MGFVVDQAPILRTIGGRDVHRAQLRQLLDISRLRHIAIQVMPLDCEVHPGSDGPMVLLDTPEGRKLAYIEGQGTSELVSKPDEVSVLDRRYGVIRAQALTTRESRRLIEELAGER
ncbi:DUF5753 domain-containing protein [Streptomyces sp. RB6PN25]|uniref:DUF5753 domain-containing protein n=1 Tax=Streptomyces humicola TaxID=2953240 RepID=A0ABT1PY20_9ACTN|nr:DUF5753 domain-containing protein [Streptomyces humicola]